MKIHILSPCASGQIDGTIKNQILDRLPNQVNSVLAADVVVLPISFFSNYRFNEELYKLKGKKLIVIDFLEYSTFWNGADTHLLGKNLDVAKNLCNDWEWRKLDDWVRDNPPVMYFKRELLRKDRADRVQPISFLAYLPPAPLQSKQEFDARPIDVFFAWGYSSSHRPRIHGEIVNAMATKGIGVLTHWDQVDGYFAHPHPDHTWVTIYSPWWVRRPMADILGLQHRSKISISVMGAGSICFRSMESPHGCIMAMHNDQTAWPYLWEHGVNCIRMEPGREVDDLLEATNRSDLHLIYSNSQQTLDLYRPHNYIPNYLIPAIKRAL